MLEKHVIFPLSSINYMLFVNYIFFMNITYVFAIITCLGFLVPRVRTGPWKCLKVLKIHHCFFKALKSLKNSNFWLGCLKVLEILSF